MKKLHKLWKGVASLKAKTFCKAYKDSEVPKYKSRFANKNFPVKNVIHRVKIFKK